MSITGLMHIGIYTVDIDKSLAFYIDKLGFSLYWRGFVAHPTGQVEAATILCGSCILELVTPVDLGRVHSVEGPVQHIALQVDDLEGYVAELTKKGIALEEPINWISFEGGILHCFLRGPSNERIELAQYSPQPLT